MKSLTSNQKAAGMDWLGAVAKYGGRKSDQAGAAEVLAEIERLQQRAAELEGSLSVVTDSNKWLYAEKQRLEAALERAAQPPSVSLEHFDVRRANDLGDAIVQRVCELPDRTSPDDDPQALTCYPSELHTCVVAALESEFESRTGRSCIDERGAAVTKADVPTFECNNDECGWFGLRTELVHPKHDPTALRCPECRETVTEDRPSAETEPPPPPAPPPKRVIGEYAPGFKRRTSGETGGGR